MHFRLAIKNLLGAGLRTWLNVISLTLAFLVILLMQGMYDGLFGRIEHDMIHMEVGGGQYWHESYDPYNPIILNESHGDYSFFDAEIRQGTAVPILYRNAVLYTQDGSMNMVLKGIDKDQTLLGLPVEALREKTDNIIPVFIGDMMAKMNNIQAGDIVTLRIRTESGTQDAIEAKVTEVFHTAVQSVDLGQIWIDIETLQSLIGLGHEATLLTVAQELENDHPAWNYQGMDVMFANTNSWKTQELGGAYMMMAILLGLAVLAVFDTQLLSIFRRKKEIGTLVSLGMTQKAVVWLFSVEGLFYGIISVFIGSLLGIPVLLYTSHTGLNFGEAMEGMALNFDSVIYPEFSLSMYVTVVFMVMSIVLLVSFLASRRIAKMNIVRILKGK